MKTALPPSVQLQLAEVAGIADGLAATSCDFPASAFAGMDVAGILNNLDEVASAVTAEQLADAPAMLNGAARAFRQTFPGTSEGFAEAGRLQTIASDLAAFLQAGTGSDAQEKANRAWNEKARKENRTA